MWFYYSISSQRCCIISSHGQQQYSGRLVLKWCLVGAMVVLLHIVCSTALVQGSSRFNMCIQKCSSTPSMIVTSYCCLRISSKQSCRPSQTSDTNNTFLPTELLLVGHFPFSWSYSLNTSDGYVWKIPVVYEILSQVCPVPTTIPHTKSLKKLSSPLLI